MKRIILLMLTLSLVACSDDQEHQDIKAWMATVGINKKANMPPLPEVKPYTPAAYSADLQPDPFKQGRLQPDAKLPLQGKGGGIQPDFDAREIRNNLLERYPLDSMRMVGYLVLNKQPIAVIQADQLVKQVKIGDYMGLDFGVVTKISERELTLKEMIQDSTGEWAERVNTLPLIMKDGAK